MKTERLEIGVNIRLMSVISADIPETSIQKNTTSLNFPHLEVLGYIAFMYAPVRSLLPFQESCRFALLPDIPQNEVLKSVFDFISIIMK
jgi:hypothetical protein